MKHLRKWFLPAVLGVGLLGASGCVAILAGAAGAAGGIVYLKGQLESYESQPFDQVVAAIRATATSANFGDISMTLADDEFSLRGKDADGTLVWIRAERKNAGTTRVQIRSGVMGDEAGARWLLTTIRSHYGSPSGS